MDALFYIRYWTLYYTCRALVRFVGIPLYKFHAAVTELHRRLSVKWWKLHDDVRGGSR